MGLHLFVIFFVLSHGDIASLQKTNKILRQALAAMQEVEVGGGACAWLPGDGMGGTEVSQGGLSGQECENKCRSLEGFNGVTIRVDGSPGCWCEKGMTGRDDSSDFKSCFLSHSAPTAENSDAIIVDNLSCEWHGYTSYGDFEDGSQNSWCYKNMKALGTGELATKYSTVVDTDIDDWAEYPYGCTLDVKKRGRGVQWADEFYGRSARFSRNAGSGTKCEHFGGGCICSKKPATECAKEFEKAWWGKGWSSIPVCKSTRKWIIAKQEPDDKSDFCQCLSQMEVEGFCEEEFSYSTHCGDNQCLTCRDGCVSGGKCFSKSAWNPDRFGCYQAGGVFCENGEAIAHSWD